MSIEYIDFYPEFNWWYCCFCIPWLQVPSETKEQVWAKAQRWMAEHAVKVVQIETKNLEFDNFISEDHTYRVWYTKETQVVKQ